MTLTERIDKHGMTHNDLITLTAWMAEQGHSASEVAYAVEKPWKHTDLLVQAVAAIHD